MSRKQGLISYRNGSKGSFCSKAAAAWHACACWDGRRDQSPVQCSDSATTTPRPHHGHGHTHILSYSPCQFTFSPLVSSSQSQCQIQEEEREQSCFTQKGNIQHVLQGFVTVSTGVFLSVSYGNGGRWMGIFMSSMDHVTSNDKRGSSEKTGRLLQFWVFGFYGPSKIFVTSNI